MESPQKAQERLQALRASIEEIDAGILALLEKRLRLTKEIAQVKRVMGKEVFDAEREKLLLEKLKEKASGDVLGEEELKLIWGKILELSRRLQEREMD